MIQKVVLRRMDTDEVVAERTEPPFTPLEWAGAPPWPVTVRAEAVDHRGQVYATPEYTTEPEPDAVFDLVIDDPASQTGIIDVRFDSLFGGVPPDMKWLCDWGDGRTSPPPNDMLWGYENPGTYRVRIYGVRDRMWVFDFKEPSVSIRNALNTDIAGFSRLRELRRLTLRRTRVHGDIGSLAHLTKIESLDLSDTQVSEFTAGYWNSRPYEIYAGDAKMEAPALGRFIDALYAVRDELGAQDPYISLGGNPGSNEVLVTHAAKLHEMEQAGCTIVF